MRNQLLRLLLLRCHAKSQAVSQVNSLRHCLSSSLLHSRAPYAGSKSLIFSHHFSSSTELTVEAKGTSDQPGLLIEIFGKVGKSNDDIKRDLDSHEVAITHDLILSVLRNPDTCPDVARSLFSWVLESDESHKLSSKSYNYMLGILGGNGLVKEFWDMVGIMKKKGYGVSKGTFVKVSEKFGNDGLNDDVERLKQLYASGSARGNNGSSVDEVCRTIGQNVWGDDVEKQLHEINVEFSSDLVSMVLENLEMEPNKGLIFFRWVEESGLLKHDQRTFNAIARILGREGYNEKFWRVVNEMRGAGYDMERETYVKAFDRFVKRKMIEDAVSLYEFAMMGVEKPSVHDCTFLLKKIVVAKELNMDLFSRVVRASRQGANLLTDATCNAVLKSLISVQRTGECNNVLKAMKDAGYLCSASLHSKIAFLLSNGGKEEEVIEFMNQMETSGCIQDGKTHAALVEGYCVSRDLDKASDSFREMVAKEGASCSRYALDVLVRTYCLKRRVIDAYKLVSEMVKEKGLSPWHTTYKALTSKLLKRGCFREALDIMGLMKDRGYPPYLDPFIKYLSKKGTADYAIEFSNAMTVKRYPSTAVFLRLFQAYFKEGRQNEAHDFLSKCPRYIRNHADVLNLFCTMKSRDAAKPAAMGN